MTDTLRAQVHVLALQNGSHGVVYFLWQSLSFSRIKSFPQPAIAYSASLHPSKDCFVAGGEDFKLYKFDYEDGKELGMCTWCSVVFYIADGFWSV